nr:hypothetical protein Iba_scaffold42367CG0010 [Ipomoea batatas]GME13122.1 hypothetical protein Iba_scaffold14355CG0060 [Ipomoea batatas]
MTPWLLPPWKPSKMGLLKASPSTASFPASTSKSSAGESLPYLLLPPLMKDFSFILWNPPSDQLLHGSFKIRPSTMWGVCVFRRRHCLACLNSPGTYKNRRLRSLDSR